MEGTLRWEGDVWTASLGGRVARLRDSRGLRHLAVLLAQPGREIHALDLAGAPEAARDGDAGPRLDDRARSQYKARLADLAADLDEATAHHDDERAARIRAEIDAIVDELTAATGIGGRDRGMVSDAERARVAVRRAVKAALDRITDAHPALGAHLAATVRTGTFCAYVPDPASPVRWRIGDDVPPPAVPPARRRPRPTVVGRDAEQVVLRDAFTAGGVVVLSGEPGIGKTTLLDDLTASVDVALHGRCDDQLGAPYQPVVEWLRDLVAVDGVATVATDAGAAMPALARLVPELGTAGDVERLVLFDGVVRVLRAAAARRPLLVTVDDLHWAPQPTLSLLAHVARELASAPVLLALTYRDTEVGDELRSFLTALARLDGVTRLPVHGLDVEGVCALGATEDDAKRLVEHTGGNPLFVRALIDTPHDDGLPATVVDVVTDRAARVSAEARALASVLAVAGDRIDIRVATRLGSVDAIDELLLARLLNEDGASVAFPHALVRRAIAQSVSGVRRAALHLDVARAMEQTGAPSATLSFHYAEAVPVNHPGPAVAWSIAAADEALRAVAFEEAVVHAQRGLAVVPDATREHGVLLLRLAEARHSAGDLAAARSALDEAEVIGHGLGDGELLADIALERGHRGAQVGVHEAEVAAALQDALRRLGTDDPERRTRLLSRLAIEQLGGGHLDDARHKATEALELARGIGDERLVLRALEAVHHVHDAPEHLDLRLTIAEEMESRARACGDIAMQVVATGARCTDASERGDLVAFDRHLADLHAHVERRSTLHDQWFELEQRVVRAVIVGELDDAERLAERELAVGTEGAVANAFRGYALQLLVIRDEQGRAGELADLAAGMAADAGWSDGETIMAALATAEAGRADDARALFERVDLTSLRRDTLVLGILCTSARLALAFGDVERATVVDEQLRPFAGRNCSVALGTITIGPVDRYLSCTARVLGDVERARQHLLDAIALDERMAATRWLARDRGALDQLTNLTRETTWATSQWPSSTA